MAPIPLGQCRQNLALIFYGSGDSFSEAQFWISARAPCWTTTPRPPHLAQSFKQVLHFVNTKMSVWLQTFLEFWILAPMRGGSELSPIRTDDPPRAGCLLPRPMIASDYLFLVACNACICFLVTLRCDVCCHCSVNRCECFRVDGLCLWHRVIKFVGSANLALGC